MAATMKLHDPKVFCADFSLFQELLKKMRLIDDRIANALNTTIPTESFSTKVDGAAECKELYKQLCEAHKQRRTVIEQCITESRNTVSRVKQEKLDDPDNVELSIRLRKQQTKLRLIQSELGVEEVVGVRTNKIFHERCRAHYIPDDA